MKSNYLRNKAIEMILYSLLKRKIKHQNQKAQIKILINDISKAQRVLLYNKILLTLPKSSNVYKAKKQDLSHSEQNFLIEELDSLWTEKKGENLKEKLISFIKTKKEDPNCKIKKRIDFLQKTFDLSDVEIELLIFKYLIACYDNFNNCIYFTLFSSKRQLLDFFCYFNKNKSKKDLLSQNNKLRKYEIIDEEFDISDNISNYISGFNSDFSNSIYKKYNNTPIPLIQHSIRVNDNEIIKNIIENKNKQSVNILLYGVPGTGKTEYVRSLIKHLNIDLYEMANNSKDSENLNRIFNFWLCQKTIPKSSVILIDEADNMLNGSNFFDSKRNVEKDKINEILDSNESVNFWITNHIGDMDKSTKRRFDYSIEFTEFDYEQRLNVWKNCIAKHKLKTAFSEQDVVSFAENYKLNAGGINIVLKNYKRIPKSNRCLDKLFDLIKPYQKLIGQPNTKITAVKNYSLEGLNIKGETSLKESLELISEFDKYMKTEAYKTGDIKNMNMLLYGPSGTGKTEFVKYLAKTIGRKLIVKQGSSFLNMYVGETEQNIRKAFEEASDKKAILFIDEADGLFFSRENSTRGFEVTQVNELLVQMENFQGIFICSTNFQKNMDGAAFRRFNFKFEFDFLDGVGKEVFYNLYLSNLMSSEMSDTERADLVSIKGLTPGDFKVVHQKNVFVKGDVSHEKLLKNLQSETKFKIIPESKSIGFNF